MSEVELERRGPALWVTFNRPEAHNAMTFAMYESLYEACERADADDDVRVLVLRGAGEKAFVAGTDIRQFADFDETGEDALAYEATIDRIVGRLETVGKPTVALVDGFAMGSGLALSATCDLRVCTPAAQFGLPIARTVGNCLSMENYARLAGLLGPARVKDIIFTARTIRADEALAIGLATEVVEPADAEARVEELCELLASHAPVTLKVTKEALRRIRAATTPEGDDLVREAYGSEGFRRNVAAFLARSAQVSERDDFAVEARTRIAARDRERERKEAKRAKRERILLWLFAPLLLPVAGAAAALAVLDGEGGDLSGWSSGSVALLTAALFGLPAALSAWLARRRGRIEPLGWAAITLLAQIALVFWVGLIALDLGPSSP